MDRFAMMRKGTGDALGSPRCVRWPHTVAWWPRAWHRVMPKAGGSALADGGAGVARLLLCLQT